STNPAPDSVRELGRGFGARKALDRLHDTHELIVGDTAGRTRLHMGLERFTLDERQLVFPGGGEQLVDAAAVHVSSSLRSIGSSFFFNIRRARLMRERTVPPGMPNTCAISSYASPSTSRSTRARRYRSGNVVIASPTMPWICAESTSASRFPLGSMS